MSEDYFQSKKELPPRARRGVRLEQTEEERKEDDKIYNRLFGNFDQAQSSASDSSFEGTLVIYQDQGLRRQQTYSANFVNYNFGRGYHYFFNLDTFARVEGSPSYAMDKNRFNFTYSQDESFINDIQLKKIINRQCIGLPMSTKKNQSAKNQTKNICLQYLFNNQDQKFNNHRLIAKYKYILNHLESLCNQNKLNTYTELKKSPTMFQVCNKNTSTERKRQILQSQIKCLLQTIQNMSSYLNWEDKLYYLFSLDQRFHNQALMKSQKLQIEKIHQRIFERMISRKQFIDSIQNSSTILEDQKTKIAVQSWLLYEESDNVNALSIQYQNQLKNSNKLVEMFRTKQETVIFPLFLFNLGHADQAVDTLLKSKLKDLHESQFYIYKSFIKKLFQRDLFCKQSDLGSSIIKDGYTNLMRKKLQKIQQFYNEKGKPEKKYVTIDSIVQLDKIKKIQFQQSINLLEIGNKIEISLKQLILLFLYQSISMALTSFIDYINCDPEILTLMLSPHYKKYHYGISKFIYQQDFYILTKSIETFIDFLSFPAPEFGQRFYFNFNNDLRIAYVWTENQSDSWVTEKDDEQNQSQDNQNHLINDQLGNGLEPSKKVKID